MRYKKYFRKTSLKQKGDGDFFLDQIEIKKPKCFLEVGVFHEKHQPLKNTWVFLFQSDQEKNHHPLFV